MNKVQIYLDISADGKDAMEQNGVTIKNLLVKKKLECQVFEGVLSLDENEGSNSKSIIPIILASSAALVSVGFAAATVINAFNNKKQIIVIEGLEEIRDANNNVILDKDGNPIFKTVKRIEVIDPPEKGTYNYFLVLFKYFRIKISSK